MGFRLGLVLLGAAYLFSPSCAHARLVVEGRLDVFKADGNYDFDVQVKGSAPQTRHLNLAIRVVKVDVVGKHFQIFLNTMGLEEYPLNELSFVVKVRPFQSDDEFKQTSAFQVSRLLSEPAPTVVFRSPSPD